MSWSILCLAFAPAAVASQERECDALLQPARAALEVPLDKHGKLRLVDVLARFEEVTDWSILMNEETTRLMEYVSFKSNAALHAEPEQVVAVVEAALANANFVWTPVRTAPPRLLSVMSLDTTARTTARQSAIPVPAEQIARFVDHPALLVGTVVSLPNSDVRTMSNSLRGLVVDPNTLQIIPVGNANELLLQGSGRMIADLVALLRAVDARSAPDGAGATPAARLPRKFEAKAETTLPGGDEVSMSMLELVLAFADATGQTALISEENRRLLEQTRLGLDRPLCVPAAEYPALVEELLLEHKFVLIELLEQPALFTVRSLDTTARTSSRQYARFVDAGALDVCAARPATLFCTVFDLPHSDVRTLSNSMRGMVVDPNTLQIIPVGNSSTLVLQGFGRQLARVGEVLERIDAAAAARPAVQPESVPASGGGK